MCLSAQVPIGLSNHTTRLFLNKNLLTSLAADTFSSLFLLDELDLSHNQVVNSSSYQFRACISLTPVRQQDHTVSALLSSPHLKTVVSVGWTRSPSWTCRTTVCPRWSCRCSAVCRLRPTSHITPGTVTAGWRCAQVQGCVFVVHTMSLQLSVCV